jgi:N-acetyl-alpha-D-glucosaminyl L-malate synthase BshA
MGGAGIVGCSLSFEFAVAGHTVHLFSEGTPFRKEYLELAEFHRISKGKYHTLPAPPSTLLAATKISQLASTKGLDVLNTHYAVPHAVAGYLVKQMRRSKSESLPVVNTCHGTDVYVLATKEPYRDIVKFALEECDAVVAVSEFLAKVIRRKVEVNHSKIRVIQNFVDATRFSREAFDPQLRRKLAPSTSKIVIHASNMRPIKRVQDAIRAFSIIRKEVEAKLILVGEGPVVPYIKKLVEELNLKKEVKFLRAQRAVERFYAVSDVLLLPSKVESSSLATLEAAASEVPTVAYRVGGMSETIENGRTGFLVRFGDVDELAQKTIELLMDDEKRMKMGAAARSAVIEKFSPREVTDKYIKLFEELRQ